MSCFDCKMVPCSPMFIVDYVRYVAYETYVPNCYRTITWFEICCAPSRIYPIALRLLLSLSYPFLAFLKSEKTQPMQRWIVVLPKATLISQAT